MYERDPTDRRADRRTVSATDWMRSAARHRPVRRRARGKRPAEDRRSCDVALHEAVADASARKRDRVAVAAHRRRDSGGDRARVSPAPSLSAPSASDSAWTQRRPTVQATHQQRDRVRGERHVEASTLPDDYGSQLETLVGTDGVHVIRPGRRSSTCAVSRVLPLQASVDQRAAPPKGPVATALILRSRTERLRFLNAVHRELAVTAFLARHGRHAGQLRGRAHGDADRSARLPRPCAKWQPPAT